LEVSRHPDADKLYVEKIDLGEPTGPRTILSGLVPYMTEAQLLGKLVLVVTNLKPANMRGITSHGMILCAEVKQADGSLKIELVEPAADSVLGEAVRVAGLEGTPDTVFDPKKKKDDAVFAAILAELRVSSTGVAQYRGVPLMTSEGPCQTATLCDALIR